ncbi:unnamed protein product, partial [Rotaria magnacalcarata]
MTDFIHLPVNILVKKLFDDEKPIDFRFLEYRDETTNEKRFHCPNSSSTSHFPFDILTSSDVEELFETSSMTTKTITTFK